MYEELVKRLREIADMIEYGYAGGSMTVRKAADAIESTIKAYQIMAEAYEAELNKPLWISVVDELPEDGLNVLVTDGEYVGMAWRDTYNSVTEWYAPNCLVREEMITHWMAMPKPPKEG